MIARAVSAGARPPRSRPTGPRSRASSLLPHPRRAEPLAPIALRLAAADRPDVAAVAAERLDDRRLVELDVVGQDGDGVLRPEPDLVGDLVRPADDQPVDLVRRETLRRRERRAAIDDDRLVTELAGEADERSSDLDGTDDDQPGPGGKRLDEDRPALDLDGPRGSPEEGLARSGDEGGIRSRRAQRAVDDPVGGDDDLGRWRGAVAGRPRPELGGRGVRRATTVATAMLRTRAPVSTDAGSAGSISTSIVPPHASPTSHASSSLIP